MISRIHLHSDLLEQELAKAVKIAYHKRDLEELRGFVEIGFDITPNALNIPDLTIMHQAVLDNAVEIVEFLLEMKIDPDIKDLGGRNVTPLHLAAHRSRTEIATRLIEDGADVNAIDDNDMSPLMYAIIPSTEDMIILLLSNGAKLYDKQGSTLLHYAAINGSDIALRLLIEHGAYDDMKTHGAKVLKELKHCEIGIEDQYLSEFEEFLREKALHPDQPNDNNDGQITKQITNNKYNQCSHFNSNGKVLHKEAHGEEKYSIDYNNSKH